MNKADLAVRVADELQTSKLEATRMIETVVGAIIEGLRDDGKVAISGFGTFTRRRRKARNGVHPITRAPLEIKAGATAAFRVSQQLRALLQD